ncbi:hypothetical protein HYALB_00013161 [Hymenoscyphus albidus]|uniref:Uncharacterized protein n=1 Tax=Hymenoscyphus albidus TaxID=595503 RepID=A0A9N9LY70_9HELO|nr:hypothetical protein HYALB_00013161 [Hymenoscyphus albidus]
MPTRTRPTTKLPKDKRDEIVQRYIANPWLEEDEKTAAWEEMGITKRQFDSRWTECNNRRGSPALAHARSECHRINALPEAQRESEKRAYKETVGWGGYTNDDGSPMDVLAVIGGFAAAARRAVVERNSSLLIRRYFLPARGAGVWCYGLWNSRMEVPPRGLVFKT